MAKQIQQRPLRKFRLLNGVGSHSQGGKVYRAGDGKRPGDVVASEHDLVAQWPGKFVEVDEDVPATKSAVNLVGGSPQGQQQEAAPPSKAAEPSKQPDAQEKGGDGETGGAGDLGQDVTENFPKAVEQDFRVFKREGQYFVYDADDMSKPVGPGAKKAGVDDVIVAALK